MKDTDIPGVTETDLDALWNIARLCAESGTRSYTTAQGTWRLEGRNKLVLECKQPIEFLSLTLAPEPASAAE